MKRYQKLQDERRAMVRAAAALFVDRGYDNITMRDIAESLNTPNASLRNHFASKTKLLIAVVAHIADGIGRQWEAELKEGNGTSIAKMRRLLPLHFQPSQSILLKCGQNGNAKFCTWLATALAERLSPALTGLIRQGCDDGVFRVKYPGEVAQFMLVGLQFLTQQGIRPWNVEVYMHRAAAVPSIVESLLDAQPGALAFVSVPLNAQSRQHEG